MAITSAEIHNRSFSIDRKGYDVDEVDVFLEHVADEIDNLNNQIADLQDRLNDSRFDGFDTPAKPVKPCRRVGAFVCSGSGLLAGTRRGKRTHPRARSRSERSRPTATPSRRRSSSRSVPLTRSSRRPITPRPRPFRTRRTRLSASSTAPTTTSRTSSMPFASSRTIARTRARSIRNFSPTSSTTLPASLPRSAAALRLPSLRRTTSTQPMRRHRSRSP